MSLTETLLADEAVRKQIVAAATQVLEAEVRDKRGLTGVAVKGGFKVVKGVRPGIIPLTINDLLPEFLKAVEPFYDQWKANPGGRTIREHFVANGGGVADALLAITDGRAEKSTHRTLVKAYKKLRPMGKEHVSASMPRVGELIQRFAPQ